MTTRDPRPPDDADRARAVRDLLAEVRVDEPTPPHVVARLDAVLADLAAERGDLHGALHGALHGDELAARRRRRRRSAAVVAAVAVVAVGLGGTLAGVPGDGGGLAGGGDASTASDTAGGASVPESGAVDEGEVPAGGRPGDGARDRGDVGVTTSGAALPRLSADGLVTQVRGLAAAGDLDVEALRAAPSAPDCGATPDPGDRVVAVRYDGAPAVLVVRRAARAGAGEPRVVDLVLCGRPGTARSVLVER